MAGSDRGRPEGARTGSPVATLWYLVREILVGMLVWLGVLYLLTRDRGDVGGASVTVVVAALVLLLGGFAIESIVMRKSVTLWAGCLILAGWVAWMPFSQGQNWLAAPGVLGLVVVAATPREWRERDARKQRDFLNAHDWWRTWRERTRKMLVAGVWIGGAFAVISGIMDVMPRL